MPHLTESELAGYLDHDLSATERQSVEEHLVECDSCRAELVAAARLLDQELPAGAPPAVRPQRGGRWSLPAGLVGLAAAAALAALLLVGPDAPANPEITPQQERVNPEGVDRLPVVAPPQDALVPRDELRFVWADLGTGSYRITLMAEDGATVWSASVADTTAVPPEAIELDAGARFFWWIDAISGGVVARSDPHSFIAAP